MSEQATDPIESDAFEQIQILLESIEQHPDENVRNHVRALVYTLLDLHHAALERIIGHLSNHADGREILDALGRDDLVKAVLTVHDLLPQSTESRLESALGEARENLKEYGADVELIDLRNGVAKLRLIGGAKTATVSTAILTGEIEKVLHLAVPDLLDVEYDETIAEPKPINLVQIQPLRSVQAQANGSLMMPIVRTDQLPADEFRILDIGGINILLSNVAGSINAFQNRCPADDQSLENSTLADGILTCLCHAYGYDLRRGGKCLNDAALKLESLAVKVENGVVKVAFDALTSDQ